MNITIKVDDKYKEPYRALKLGLGRSINKELASVVENHIKTLLQVNRSKLISTFDNAKSVVKGGLDDVM